MLASAAPVLSSSRTDIYEDEALRHYVKFRRHVSTVSIRQKKRVETAAKHYEWTPTPGADPSSPHCPGYFAYRADNHAPPPLLVPLPAQRTNLVSLAHLLGHFQTDTTVARLRSERFQGLLAIHGC